METKEPESKPWEGEPVGRDEDIGWGSGLERSNQSEEARNHISPLITNKSEWEEEQPYEKQRLTCNEIGLSIFDRKTSLW